MRIIKIFFQHLKGFLQFVLLDINSEILGHNHSEVNKN